MTRDMILTQAVLPSTSLSTKAMMVVAGTVLLSLGAQIEVPMFPVPMSLQTLVISIIGLTYGARLAAVTLIAYLLEGAMGLPVFAGGGAGLAWLMGPTGGFLLGFVAMAWATGWLAERGFAKGAVRLFVAAFVPATLLFVPGVLWLWYITPLDLQGALNAGFYPFLIGDVVKSTLAALAVSGGWAMLGKRRG